MTDEPLDRIRRALHSGEGPPAPSPLPDLERGRLVDRALDGEDRISRFAARAASSGAEVHRVDSVDDLKATLQKILAGAASLAVASRGRLEERLGIGAGEVAPPSCTLLDAGGLDKEELFGIDAALTGVDLGIAETGSILLGTEEGAGHLVSLVAEIHVALVWPDQIEADLLDWTRNHAGAILISGPSKTADIEIKLVVGVHGPGQLHLIVVEYPLDGPAHSGPGA